MAQWRPAIDRHLPADPVLQRLQPHRLLGAEEPLGERELKAGGGRKSVRAGGSIRSAGGDGKRGQMRPAGATGICSAGRGPQLQSRHAAAKIGNAGLIVTVYLLADLVLRALDAAGVGDEVGADPLGSRAHAGPEQDAGLVLAVERGARRVALVGADREQGEEDRGQDGAGDALPVAHEEEA